MEGLLTAGIVVTAFALGALWERWNAAARIRVSSSPKPTPADVVALPTLPKTSARTVRRVSDDLPERLTPEEVREREAALRA